MAWLPGQSGNPQGRGLNEKLATEALRLAVMSPVARGKAKGQQKLRRIADKIAACAMKGEPWACCLVFDRLDGKALQSVDTTLQVSASQVFVDLLRAINDRRTIEHAPQRLSHAHKPAANAPSAGLAPIGDAVARVVERAEPASAEE